MTPQPYGIFKLVNSQFHSKIARVNQIFKSVMAFDNEFQLASITKTYRKVQTSISVTAGNG